MSSTQFVCSPLLAHLSLPLSSPHRLPSSRAHCRRQSTLPPDSLFLLPPISTSLSSSVTSPQASSAACPPRLKLRMLTLPPQPLPQTTVVVPRTSFGRERKCNSLLGLLFFFFVLKYLSNRFNIYIWDYCTKRGYANTARELVEEAKLGPTPRPPIDAKQGLLYEWVQLSTSSVKFEFNLSPFFA